MTRALLGLIDFETYKILNALWTPKKLSEEAFLEEKLKNVTK